MGYHRRCKTLRLQYLNCLSINQALTELKTVSETVLDLKDYLGISKQDAEE